ncbi:MAG: hypothetical protein M1840_005418 [Geoglossum simile]|nr:MAG: hypothetical protein M1840_005418 [Geoglossum simile]
MTQDSGGVEEVEDGLPVVLPLENHYFTPGSYLALQPATAPHPLFIYGSLLIVDNLHMATGSYTPVVDLAHNTTAGVLRGYRRHALRGASFPAIVPNAASDPNASSDSTLVAGALVLGLNEEERESVDGFEAGLYDLVEVDVEIRLAIGGVLRTEVVRAETYVWSFDEPAVEVVPIEEGEWSIEPLLKGTWSGN